MRLPRLFARNQAAPDTGPKPVPDTRPIGGSGRFHTGGYLQFEELNLELQHPWGHTVYDRMWRTDPDVRGKLAMCLNPLLAGTWTIEPYGGDNATPLDVECAELVRWALFEFMKPGLLGHLAEVLPLVARSGFAPCEQLWTSTTYHGRQVLVPAKLAIRLPRSVHRWIQTPTEDLQSIEQHLPEGFTEIPARDLVYYRVGAEGDNWEGTSLLRPVYKAWWFKDNLERIDAIAQELEGTGLPTVYPPLGGSDDADVLDGLEEKLSQIRAGETAYLMMPGPAAQDLGPDQAGQGWRLEILGRGQASGSSGRDALPSLNYHKDAIAAGLIAEFMRLGQAGVGARATADVQQDPFLAAVEGFAGTVIEETLNHGGPGMPFGLVPRIAYANFAGIEGPPTLSLGLVDSTSLGELGDYVQKLAAGGALFPDDALEDYLRDRADMPPADAKARRDRLARAEKMQQVAEKAAAAPAVVPGQPPAAEPAPVPGKPAAPAAKAAAPPAQPAPPPAKAKTAARQSRPLRHWEEHVNFDQVEEAIDGARARFEAAGADAARACARDVAAGVAAGKDTPPRPPAELIAALAGVLGDLYALGRTSVADELARQAGQPAPQHYARRDAVRTMARRAKIAAQHIANMVHRAAIALDLTGPRTEAELQTAAEQAATSGLRAEAVVHAAPALNTGRSDEADAQAARIRGSRYTALLSSDSCCDVCRAADDDVLRALDDPIRLARKPPNRDCEGGDRCRCLEFFELLTETPAKASRADDPKDEPVADRLLLFEYREDQHPRWPRGGPQGGRFRPKGEHPGSTGRGSGVTLAGLRHTDLIGMQVWTPNPAWKPGSGEPTMLPGVLTEAYGVDDYLDPITGERVKLSEPEVFAVVELPDGTAMLVNTGGMRRRGRGARDPVVRKRELAKDWQPPKPLPPKPDPAAALDIKALAAIVNTGHGADGHKLTVREREAHTTALGKAIMAQVDEGTIRRIEEDGERRLAANKLELARIDEEARASYRIPYADRTPEMRARQSELSDQDRALRVENAAIRRQVKTARGEALRQVLSRHVELADPTRPKSDKRNHLQVGTGKVAKTVRDATRFVPADWVEASNADARQLTVATSRSRAYFSEGKVVKRKGNATLVRIISTHEDDASTALHEFGHNVQYLHPDLNALEQAHIQRRVEQTPDPTRRQVRPLAAIYPGSGYGRRERAVEDEFANAYTGKDYGGGVYTEVLTMGAQLAFFGDGTREEGGQSGGRRPGASGPAGGAWGDDPELVAFTVGVFAGLRRDLAAEHAERDRADRQRAAFASAHSSEIDEIDKTLADLDEAAYRSYEWRVKADRLRSARESALKGMSAEDLAGAVKDAREHQAALRTDADKWAAIASRKRELESKLAQIDTADERAAWQRTLDMYAGRGDLKGMDEWERSLDSTIKDQPRRNRETRAKVEAFIGRFAAFPDYRAMADAMREVLKDGETGRIRLLLAALVMADNGRAGIGDVKDLLAEWGYTV